MKRRFYDVGFVRALSHAFLCVVTATSSLIAVSQPCYGFGSDGKGPATTITVSTLVVNMYVVVQDREGRLVPGLNKEDFVLKQDKVQQDIRYFARNTEAPLTLGIVVDTSPSQKSMLKTEQTQAKELLHQLLRPGDKAFVLTFDERAEMLQDLTSDKTLLSRAIDQIQGTITRPVVSSLLSGQNTTKPSGTRLYDTLALISSKLASEEAGRKVIVLLTDGEDQGSTLKMKAALQQAGRADLILYAVAISDTSFYMARDMAFRGKAVLNKLSAATGGRTIQVDQSHPELLAFAIHQIAEEVRGQYLLGYTPSRRPNREYHTVSITVQKRNCRVRARSGYFGQTD